MTTRGWVAGCRHVKTEFSVNNKMYYVNSNFETILVNGSISLLYIYFNHSRANSARWVAKKVQITDKFVQFQITSKLLHVSMVKTTRQHYTVTVVRNSWYIYVQIQISYQDLVCVRGMMLGIGFVHDFLSRVPVTWWNCVNIHIYRNLVNIANLVYNFS
jgi:hypothetical protein